jgi:hypothetical protein
MHIADGTWTRCARWTAAAAALRGAAARALLRPGLGLGHRPAAAHRLGRPADRRAMLGCFIGVLSQASARRPRLQDAHEAIAAMVATFIATAVAHYAAPLSLQNVIVASLIVLMPGLTLTTAVAELSEPSSWPRAPRASPTR